MQVKLTAPADEEKIQTVHDDIDVLSGEFDSLEDENTKLKAELKRQAESIDSLENHNIRKKN